MGGSSTPVLLNVWGGHHWWEMETRFYFLFLSFGLLLIMSHYKI